jgi:Pao retrotransposon peptidase
MIILDLLGLLIPFFLAPKLLWQDHSPFRLSWYNLVPEEVIINWNVCPSQTMSNDILKLPRYLGSISNRHAGVFSDASFFAVGYRAYLY